jgi:hypothetical protein
MTGVGLDLADHNLEQRRLAHAVGADQPPLVAPVHSERDVGEHLIVAVGFGEIGKRQEHPG